MYEDAVDRSVGRLLYRFPQVKPPTTTLHDKGNRPPFSRRYDSIPALQPGTGPGALERRRIVIPPRVPLPGPFVTVPPLRLRRRTCTGSYLVTVRAAASVRGRTRTGKFWLFIYKASLTV
jgi:hypothetical protein